MGRGAKRSSLSGKLERAENSIFDIITDQAKVTPGFHL